MIPKKIGRPVNPNKIPKKITSFNLDHDLVTDLKIFCKKEDKDMSKVANSVLKNFVKSIKR